MSDNKKDWVIVGDLGYDQVVVVAFPHATGGWKALEFDEDAAIAIRDNFIAARALNTGRWTTAEAGHVPPLGDREMSTAPTLREDVQEMITRMTDVEKGLAAKLANNQDWTRDERVECIDAFDSAIELGKIVLPYIPPNAVSSAGGGVHAQSALPALKPHTGHPNQTFTGWVKFVADGGHRLIKYLNVFSIEEKDGYVFVNGEGYPWTIFKAADVWGYWLDAGGADKGNNHKFSFFWEAPESGDRPSEDVLLGYSVRMESGRWALTKVMGPTNEVSEQPIGYFRPDIVQYIDRDGHL